MLLLSLLVSCTWAADKPNFVIILTDDQGYQDLGCFGSPLIKTPRIDQMAKEGMKLTSFYAQTVCGPSRAALMTGCYPLRIATKDNRVEYHPRMHSKEVTIAEVLKSAGYATGAFGKWDLAGHSQTQYEPELLPTFQGFDCFFGTPTSNDRFVNLLRDTELVEEKASMDQLTRRFTDEAIAFIKQNKEKPFFVYLAHSMPHIRLGVSGPFKGKSARGVYGDVIEEIDWNVGRILDVLAEEQLDKTTYVVFTSDNGPWFLGNWQKPKKEYGKDYVNHFGSALPLRGDKTTTWEGGLRVPCVVWAPGRVPAGSVCDEMASTMDLLPTLANLAGAELPGDRVIDGDDMTPLIHGVDGAKGRKDVFFYYQQTSLQAVRSGPWKLHLPGKREWQLFCRPKDRLPFNKPMLYHLETDVGETTDVAKEHPEIVERLLALAEEARKDIGDFNRIGAGARFFDPAPHRPDIGRRHR